MKKEPNGDGVKYAIVAFATVMLVIKCMEQIGHDKPSTERTLCLTPCGGLIGAAMQAIQQRKWFSAAFFCCGIPATIYLYAT